MKKKWRKWFFWGLVLGYNKKDIGQICNFSFWGGWFWEFRSGNKTVVVDGQNLLVSLLLLVRRKIRCERRS